ncbi:MAG: HlyD family efflux transporter periplasmic adaptor subunit [Bacteroidetes bacterium]|nr:HlyD family efflux transporter periplasmic adaptor subunit [Bacteroidota bacterium]
MQVEQDQHTSILSRKLGEGEYGSTGEGSDRRIARSRWTPRRILSILGVVAVIALIAWAYSTATGGRRLRVDADRVTIADVENGPFQEYAQVTGNVLPRTTVYLDAVEGGRVEELFVEEGTRVEKGQPLLRLSNNDLQIRLINADAQRIEQINRVQDTQFRMEQNALSLRQQLVQMNYQIERLRRAHTRNKDLYAQKAISQQEFDQTETELDYWMRNKDLTLAAYKQDSLRMAKQLVQMQGSVNRMDANFRVIQEIADNLTVTAPISGQLTALDAEIGELHSAGYRFGQIDELDGFKLRAGVDEFYIARVFAGQTATTLPVAGEEYKLIVRRVYPEVQNGRFEVDLDFTGTQPTGIRRGQTIRFRLEMSDPAEALLIPRGGFLQTTGGSWVFVVDEDGTARRRDIQVGRQNPQVVEVIEGLEPGERVITSSYESFGDADILVLN